MRTIIEGGYYTFRDQLKLLGIIAIPVLAIVAIPVLITLTIWGVVSAQTDSLTLATCPERSSTYQDGVLIYQCEIVDRGGQFVVRETARDGSVTERPASAVEISLYTAITAERDCVARKQLAENILATPIAQPVDVQSLASRLQLVEDMIRECVQ